MPEFTPKLPDSLQGPTGTILSYTAGGGLALAVLGGLVGWACVAIGHNTERGTLASRGKSGIIYSLIAGLGIGVTSSLVMAFYGMAN
ncbi:hypothetical protein [Streptomyces spirodelae]|uniref:hypothetical protein n=1 Tax=Streptomyces spirodelae TaxID=2812904 RepID=UPI001E3E924B|nr:hypothetical protein [Streptomyces spirodelae]